ncbi:maleate cis-trans isomerase family protein [Eilatimonas milleporae]|uniref:Maleate isomerase n=1 Tax=Eilatimonas milleporae TaxID=911205 RepID=A0A3M0BZY0_9PROT|nr:hypothetical protein [Eilatimonas milleporae]RMB01937.1 maleate isomerase [Eilatimonas milleporae]
MTNANERWPSDPMLADRPVLSSRLKIGVVGPSTNTVVQPDFDDMRPVGVTNHYSPIIIQNQQAISNETFQEGVEIISDNVRAAVSASLSCKPDVLSMGMSAVTFWGGAKGAEKFKHDMEELSGRSMTCGSLSLIEAFNAYGGIRRVSFISPYYPVANAQVTRFFADHGVEVVRDISLQCPSWTAISEVREEHLRERLKDLDGDTVDALVQVGTNLSMVRLAAAAEKWLGKPVIAINTATYWSALRNAGIKDRIYGFGRLLEDY